MGATRKIDVKPLSLRLSPWWLSPRSSERGPVEAPDLKAGPTAFKLCGQENTINDDFACGSRWLSVALRRAL